MGGFSPVPLCWGGEWKFAPTIFHVYEDLPRPSSFFFIVDSHLKFKQKVLTTTTDSRPIISQMYLASAIVTIIRLFVCSPISQKKLRLQLLLHLSGQRQHCCWQQQLVVLTVHASSSSQAANIWRNFSEKDIFMSLSDRLMWLALGIFFQQQRA